MDISSILTAVSTVGFPIVACGAMFWMINKMSDQHKDEMSEVTRSINHNTVAITKLCELINKENA